MRALPISHSRAAAAQHELKLATRLSRAGARGHREMHKSRPSCKARFYHLEARRDSSKRRSDIKKKLNQGSYAEEEACQRSEAPALTAHIPGFYSRHNSLPPSRTQKKANTPNP